MLSYMAAYVEQGSTKIFKSRAKSTQSAPGTNVSASPSAPSATTQRMVATIDPSASILLLPDPVTCFASSSYSQTQTFHLPAMSSIGGSSAIILDWFTSGRMARDEEWAFERYRSCNEIWIGGRRVARDVMLLEQHAHTTFTSPPPPSAEFESNEQRPPLALPPRTLRSRLAPYACYATLFLVGPLAAPIITSLSAQFAAIQQMQIATPDRLLWALSPLRVPTETPTAGGNQGAVVRVMGMETELVREWLKAALRPLKDSIGTDAYRTAFM